MPGGCSLQRAAAAHKFRSAGSRAALCTRHCPCAGARVTAGGAAHVRSVPVCVLCLFCRLLHCPVRLSIPHPPRCRPALAAAGQVCWVAEAGQPGGHHAPGARSCKAAPACTHPHRGPVQRDGRAGTGLHITLSFLPSSHARDCAFHALQALKETRSMPGVSLLPQLQSRPGPDSRP